MNCIVRRLRIVPVSFINCCYIPQCPALTPLVSASLTHTCSLTPSSNRDAAGGRTETRACFATLREAKTTSILPNVSQTELSALIPGRWGPFYYCNLFSSHIFLRWIKAVRNVMSSGIQRFVVEMKVNRRFGRIHRLHLLGVCFTLFSYKVLSLLP
jgi:hypothetical protein